MSDAHDRHEVPPAPPPPQGGAPGSRRSTVGAGPIILIVLGLVLLASNFGWFSFGEIFRLLSYWPIALVAIGVDMLTHGRYRLVVIAVAIALALVLWGGNVGGRGGWTIGAVSSATQTHDVAVPQGGANAGRLVLDLGVGQVRVDGEAPAGSLVSGTVLTGRGESLNQSSELEGGVRTVRLRSEQERMASFNIRGDERRWHLSLSREVPMALSVSAGVGQTTLDLSRVELTGISFDGGVGESTVTLPAGHYSGSFDLGVGSTTIRLPRDAAVQVVVTSGLGRVTMPRDLSRSGDVYTSAGFDGASERITLRVDGGVGSIRVDRR